MREPELELTINDDFVPVSYDQWRALVESQLHGRTFDEALVTRTMEGIDLEPLYTRRDEPSENWWPGQPGQPPFIRGTRREGSARAGWDLRQHYAHPDVQIVNQWIQQDLQGGVKSLHLKLDAAARDGLDSDDVAAAECVACDGVAAYHAQDLLLVLKDVDLRKVPVALDAGAAFLPAASQLVALWHQHGLTAHEPHGAFGADPLAVLTRQGRLPYSAAAALSMLAELARWTHQHCSHVTAVGVDTTAYHHAGATETQDIAFALATGVVYLRAMEQQGLSIDAAAPQIQFRMSVDTDLFFAVAKLRAARWLWWQVVRACSGSPAAGAMRLEVRTSERVLTRRDPHLNLLRNLMGVMAAALGGSDIISSVPFDARVDLPDEFSRRLARNTLLILQHEAQLNRVIDAAGGSWYVERLTRQLAQHAWQLFQDIERRGGMMSALASGLISQQVETAAAARQASWVSRRPVIADDDGAARNDDPHTQRTEVNIDALRRAAMERLAARPSPPVSIPAAADRVKEAVAAATRGASIAQLASALGFQSDATTIAALRPDYRADWLEASPDSAAARNR